MPENQLSVLHEPVACLPVTPNETVAKLTRAQEILLKTEQGPVWMSHIIHGGMYARTATMPPESYLIGALIKIPTILITIGTGKVLSGEEWKDVNGYHVLAASAGRKQIFVSEGPLVITMVFPTSSKTVEDAEKEFTDEWELLLSHRQDLNTVTITGE